MPKRIVIAGAGIVGASIAYHLAKLGARVTILDAVQPAAGASGKSFGWLNATFSKWPRSYYEFNLLGMEGWHRLEHELDGALEIQWCGSVAWAPAGPDAEELERSVRLHQEWGYVARLITKPEFDRLLPNVSPGEVAIACHCEQEGSVDPAHAVAMLFANARSLGVELVAPCQLIGFESDGVQTSTGRMQADAVVLACGVDSPRLAALAGIRVLLKDSPGVLIHTAPMPTLIDRIVLAPGVHLKQESDGRIIAGGQIVAGAGTSEAPMADEQHILEQATRFLPALKTATVDHATLGYRVMPEDEYPIAGFASDRRDIYIAATHSGVTLAPAIGELAALEIMDAKQASLLKPYRPSRFA
jgi:glycine/D-amino acid oxidase-like deaminating enzyme